MPQKKKKQAKRVMKNVPRRQPSAGASIARGLSNIADRFLPGAGSVVSGVGRLFGFGAYTTEQAERILASRVPEMHATLDRGVRIAHHEYLGDVMSSTEFTSRMYPLNPGIQTTFPWLSTVAAAFQEYEINGLIFFFKSTSASALNSTNTALGQIIGAVQYNPYQPAPTSKIEMLGLSSSSDGKPSESNIYPVECKADMTLFRSKLMRGAAVTDDLAKYDHGNFILGAAGSQAAAVVGELHVVYDLLLKKPKLWNTGSFQGWFAQMSSDATTDDTHPLGTVAFTEQANNLGIIVNPAANTITIPAAQSVAGTHYRLNIVWSGAADEKKVVVPNVDPTTNCVGYSDIRGYAAWDFLVRSNSVIGDKGMLVFDFTINASNTNTVLTLDPDGCHLPSGAFRAVWLAVSEIGVVP
jgi:hypothetical protein